MWKPCRYKVPHGQQHRDGLPRGCCGLCSTIRQGSSWSRESKVYLLYPRLLTGIRAAYIQCGPAIARSGSLLQTRASLCALLLRTTPVNPRNEAEMGPWTWAMAFWWSCQGCQGDPWATSELCTWTCSEGWGSAADPVLLWQKKANTPLSEVMEEGSGGIIDVNRPGVTNNNHSLKGKTSKEVNSAPSSLWALFKGHDLDTVPRSLALYIKGLCTEGICTSSWQTVCVVFKIQLNV